MNFPGPLFRGRLVQRYKRFLADIILDSGETITASCPNTGAMLGLSTPGLVVWVSHNTIPTRKYRYTLELVETGSGETATLVGINTGLPNKIVGEALALGQLAPFGGYDTIASEQKYGVNSRIDFLLDDRVKGRCYVEVKNVHLLRTQGLAEFPDSVTARGAKHLDELADMVRQGHRSVMLYLIQRADVARFSLARDIDPAYHAAFVRAREAGVKTVACRCTITPQSITIAGLVEIL